jgi:hypothetical protein
MFIASPSSADQCRQYGKQTPVVQVITRALTPWINPYPENHFRRKMQLDRNTAFALPIRMCFMAADLRQDTFA